MHLFNLLTDKNILTQLIVILSTIIELYIFLSFFTTFQEIYPKRTKKLLFLLITSTITCIIDLIIPTPLSIFLNYICIIVSLHLIFKINLLKTIFTLVLTSIINVLIGLLVINPYLKLFNVSSYILDTTPYYKIGYLVLNYFVNIFILKIIKIYKFNINIDYRFDKKTKILFSINFLIGIITLLLQSVYTFKNVDNQSLGTTFLTFICLALYFTFSLYSINKVIKLDDANDKLKSAQEYNNTLSTLHDGVRCFKHDFDNIVTTIGGFIATEDLPGLKDYYKELEKETQSLNTLYLLNPKLLNSPGLFNLLNSKYAKAESLNIKVNMTVLLDFSKLRMNPYQFSRIMGILLDNAIEAASESDDKILNLEFRYETRSFRQAIIIENTYKNTDINLSTIFNKGVSGKENHTGLGLYKVKNIISKKQNVYLDTNKTNKFFTQELYIY